MSFRGIWRNHLARFFEKWELTRKPIRLISYYVCQKLVRATVNIVIRYIVQRRGAPKSLALRIMDPLAG